MQEGFQANTHTGPAGSALSSLLQVAHTAWHTNVSLSATGTNRGQSTTHAVLPVLVSNSKDGMHSCKEEKSRAASRNTDIAGTSGGSGMCARRIASLVGVACRLLPRNAVLNFPRERFQQPRRGLAALLNETFFGLVEQHARRKHTA